LKDISAGLRSNPTENGIQPRSDYTPLLGISLFGLESKLGVQIDAFKLLIGTFAILFVLLFLGFLVFIRPKKTKL
jgi:hypothetical protein